MSSILDKKIMTKLIQDKVIIDFFNEEEKLLQNYIETCDLDKVYFFRGRLAELRIIQEKIKNYISGGE